MPPTRPALHYATTITIDFALTRYTSLVPAFRASRISVLRSVNFFDLFGLFGTASYERVDDSSKFLNLRVRIISRTQ